MNNLGALKSKLMVKPAVIEREKVVVAVNPTKKKPNKSIVKVLEEGLVDLSEDISSLQKAEGVLPVEINADEMQDRHVKNEPKGITIVDRTKEGFDRDALLKKLAENKKNKVNVKQTVEIAEDVDKILPRTEPEPVKPKKVVVKKKFIIEDDSEGEKPEKEQKEEPTDKIIVNVDEKRKRKTKKVVKGIAVLGPEVIVDMGDTEITKRLPKKNPPINIKVGSYVMNNREAFVNFINSIFEPYKKELESNKESISCDNIGKTSTDFSLLTHQLIVRDYMNLYTPYRGLLLYHGLGSGKTCTSIAIAEGMKDSKKVIVMTPASLRANYIGELKMCGDSLYKQNQFWEWISTEEHPETLKTMSAILNLPQEYIEKQKGAFFVNIKKPSNFENLSDTDKQVLDQQLNEMIRHKYEFINYNGLRERRMAELTNNYTKNIFDNSVVIIDEAHNLISRIVNKLKKEKDIPENKQGEKDRMPLSLSVKIYEMLLTAKNARIVLLSGTPIINYPNEFAILFNILRGYIKTWKIPIVTTTNNKVDKNFLQNLLLGEKTLDYLDYSPSSKILTITRNPFGFKNKIKKNSGYQGVTNEKKNNDGELVFDTEFNSDEEFERKIISILKGAKIDVLPQGIEIKYRKPLPDKLDDFTNRYINDSDKSLKNEDALKRRILGLTSYFRSAQENLLPRYNKELGKDYHIIRIPMSDQQFKLYEAARVEERKLELKQKKSRGDDFSEKPSYYRIFSRLICNFAIPSRPMPDKKGKKDGDDDDNEEDDGGMADIVKEGKKLDKKTDLEDTREGEVEGDEVLDELGGANYMERLQNKLKEMEENSNDYFTPEALVTYSPKFLNILENVQDEDYPGLHLIYTQFRTAEGIGLLSLVLNKNGFTQFKIKKINDIWKIDIPEKDLGKPTYGLYTGTETVEEKEIIRKIYNGEWDKIPESIGAELRSRYTNNNMGEVIKIFMITSSGSEGINLRNTRYVHVVDPYWHPVRVEQVIGRARRICSHKELPVELQTVEVFVYLMTFTEEQLKSDISIELKRKDLSKMTPKVPLSSDQFLFEISEIKAKLTSQMTDVIKQSAFDCYIYSNGKCANFSNATIDKFAYVPDYAEQQSDVIVQANKRVIEWTGKPVNINGVDYVYRRINNETLYVYDKKSYEDALQNPEVQPLQIGVLRKNDRGEMVLDRSGFV
jgi:hypothetical protein